MSKEDDALKLQKMKISKGPTAEDLKRLAAQAEWLKRINWKAVRRAAYAELRDATISKELADEVYLRMLQLDLEELDGFDDPQSYANCAVRNRVRDWKKKYPRIIPLPEEIADGALPLEEVVSLDQLRMDPDRVLGNMAMWSKSWTRPWLLHRIEKYTHEEIAEMLNLTAHAVRNRIRRGDNCLMMADMVIEKSPVAEWLRKFIKRKEHRHGK